MNFDPKHGNRQFLMASNWQLKAPLGNTILEMKCRHTLCFQIKPYEDEGKYSIVAIMITQAGV